jgi:hypothetical protein
MLDAGLELEPWRRNLLDRLKSTGPAEWDIVSRVLRRTRPVLCPRITTLVFGLLESS